MAKNAKFAPVCWELKCPSCDTVLPSPYNGSEYWSAEDLTSPRLIRSANLMTGKSTVGTACVNPKCGRWVTLPKSLLAKAA